MLILITMELEDERPPTCHLNAAERNIKGISAESYGPATLAFTILLLMSAFIVDDANALIIKFLWTIPLKIIVNILYMITGLLVGFITIFLVIDDIDSSWESGFINLDYADQTYLTWPFNFNDRWHMKPDRSHWLTRSEGSIEVFLTQRPRSYLILRVQARLDKNSASNFKSANLLVHDVKLGELKFKPGRIRVEKELLVPQEIAVKSKLLTIKLQTKLKQNIPKNFIMGVHNISLKDPPEKSDFKGHVDVCNEKYISGWASYLGEGVTPIIKHNGKILKRVSSLLARPDLPRHGFPLKAGFRYHFSSPPKSGDVIEISFPYGAKVPGSRCSF